MGLKWSMLNTKKKTPDTYYYDACNTMYKNIINPLRYRTHVPCPDHALSGRPPDREPAPADRAPQCPDPGPSGQAHGPILLLALGPRRARGASQTDTEPRVRVRVLCQSQNCERLFLLSTFGGGLHRYFAALVDDRVYDQGKYT